MQKILDWYLKFYPINGVSLNRRIAIHVSFWVVWGLCSFMAFITNQDTTDRLLITLFLILQGSTIYYGITYFAFPNLFSPKRLIIGLFALFFVYCANYLENLAFNILGLKYNLFAPNSYTYFYAQIYVKKGFWGFLKPQNIFFEMFMALNTIALPFLLKFSRVITEYSMGITKLIKEKADLEIDFLRTQLNPHFFLNSLNNIYSKVMSKDESAGDSIVVLSDLMKYILYNSGEELVDLDSEIHFIRDYVDLEKLRGNKHLKIKFSQEGNLTDHKIAPLILINYVENAFKHGTNHDGKVTLIDIGIKFIGETLSVKIENDFIEKLTNDKQNKDGGVGIANTRKRLALLYPERHSLTIKQANNKFLVELMIKLGRE